MPIKTILAMAITVLTFTAQANAAPPSQACKQIYANLLNYTNTVNANIAPSNPSQASTLTARAQERFSDICPNYQPGNGFSTPTEYECPVLKTSASAIVSLGLNTSLTLDNSGNPSDKIVCMSSDACNTIVDQKFEILGNTAVTAECSDPNASNVIPILSLATGFNERSRW